MIHYKTGDATRPDESPAVLVHCCNNIGRWGSGFVLAIDDTFGRHVGNKYRRSDYESLGKIQPIRVAAPDSNVDFVINLIGQAGVRSHSNPYPVQYDAIREGLARLDELLNIAAVHHKVVMPRIGCGLAGGRWRDVEWIINATMPNRDVYVYDLPGAVEGKDWNP